MHTILLLAAGSSSRMGQSKQLLTVDGEALLTRSAKAACAAAPVVAVVLGARFEEHERALDGLPLIIVENKGWEKGMGNSLKAGLFELLRSVPDAQTVTIMVCDQPNISSAHLGRLLEQSGKTEKSIVASAYSGTLGVPALFKRDRFPDLQATTDEAGAAKLIRTHPEMVEAVDFPGGTIDLDTPEDYKAFTSGRSHTRS